MEDASLDEFLNASDETHEQATEQTEESEKDEDRMNESTMDIEPAVGTSRWTPAGDECEECETTVKRRWEDDGKQVCSDCKEW